MEPKLIVKFECDDRGCPAFYDDGDSYLIQGYQADGALRADLVPDGERVVRIPKSLVDQLAQVNRQNA